MNYDRMRIVKSSDIHKEVYRFRQDISAKPSVEVLHHTWEGGAVELWSKAIPADLSTSFAANKIEGTSARDNYIFTGSITMVTSRRICLFLCDGDIQEAYGFFEMPYSSVRQIKIENTSILNMAFKYEQGDVNILWNHTWDRPHLKATFVWWNTFANWLAKVESIEEGDIIADAMTSSQMTGFNVPNDFVGEYEKQRNKKSKTLYDLGFVVSSNENPPSIYKPVLRCKLKELGLAQTSQSGQDNSNQGKTSIDNEKTHSANLDGLTNGATGFLALSNLRWNQSDGEGLIDNSEKITRIYNSSDHINSIPEASAFIATLTSAGVSPNRADTIMHIASFCIKNKIKLGSTPSYSYWEGSKQPIAFSPKHNILLFSEDINTAHVPMLQECLKVISINYSFANPDINKKEITPHAEATNQANLIDKKSDNLMAQSDNLIQNLTIFSPSLASIPSGISTINQGIEGVVSCLANRADGIQSFFGKQELSKEGEKGIYIRDEILHITPFDEKLWCQMFREAGRYKIADLYDQRQENAHKRGEKFKKFGILAGIFTLNPLVPFMAYGQGVSGAPKGSKLDELIPDPQIEFLKDTNSYTSMTNMGGVIGKRRRIIMHKMEGSSGCYYRLIPAIVTHEHIIPCQVFDFEGQNFLRPIAAGINRNQDNYDAAKIHRRYYHLRNEGKSQDTNERIKVFGDDIEEQQLRVFSFSSDITNLEYLYIEYATLPNHVF